MSRVHLTALVAALAVGTVAPRLAAQDTSSAAGGSRRDTSAYTGAGGIDTSARPGRVGADTISGGAADTAGLTGAARDSTKVGQQTPRQSSTEERRLRPSKNKSGAAGQDTSSAPGRADADSTGPLGSSDSSGMRGRHPDSTRVGDTTSPSSGVTLPSDTGSSSDAGGTSRRSQTSGSDTSGTTQPSRQPGQSTSPSGP
jgi:hypothetical protein